MSDQTSLAKEEHITLEDINNIDVEENIRDIVSEESSDSKSAKTDLEIYSLIPAGDATLRGQATIAINEEEKGVINEGSIIPSRHLSIVSTKTLYDQTMKTFLSNPLLAEALKDYFELNETPQLSPSTPETDLHLARIPLMGVACMHRVLETQVELVETRHKIASNLVRQALCEEYKLLQHFMVLRNVFFMESGIFAQRFYSYLFKEIELGHWRNRVNLTVHLQNCVKELFPGFHSCFSVNINTAQSTDKIQQAIQAISIAYTVDWPISLVITDEAIESYNKVFRFLLHIKYAFWILQDIRFSELAKSSNILRVKRLQALKMWMYHSTNTLHSYFMGLVLRCYSDHLKESVEHANSLADIINAHKKYLVEIKTHCLQLKKSYLDIFIMKLVWQCQDLADLWMLEAAGHLLDSDVEGLEQQYFGAYMGLADCLEAITSEVDDEINPLWELRAEFLNSIPNVYQGGVSVKIN